MNEENLTLKEESPPSSYDASFGGCQRLVCTDEVAVDSYDPSDPMCLGGKFAATYANGTTIEFQAVFVSALFHGAIPYYDDDGNRFLLTDRRIISVMAHKASVLESFGIGEVSLPPEDESESWIERLRVPNPYDMLDYDPVRRWYDVWFRSGLLVRMVDGSLAIDAAIPLGMSKYRVSKCHYYGEEDAMIVGARPVVERGKEDIPMFESDDVFADNACGDAVSVVCLDIRGTGIPYVPSNPLNHSARLEITYSDGTKILSSVAFCDVLLCGDMRDENGALIGNRRVLAAIADLAAQCRLLDKHEELELPSAEDAEDILGRYGVPDVPISYDGVSRVYNAWLKRWEQAGVVVRIGSEDDAQYVTRMGCQTISAQHETPRQTVERVLESSQG